MPRSGRWTPLLPVALQLAMIAMTAGCGQTDKPATGKSEPPAKVVKTPSETELSVLYLTEKAVDRLGITLAPVARQSMPRHRRLGGEVLIPPGNTVIVSAPLAGTLTAPEGKPIPLPGAHVTAGDPILTFIPLLSPERAVPTPAERILMANARATLATSQIAADGDVQRGTAETEAAQIAVDRADQLLRDRAGSARLLDEARAQLQVAQKTLNASRERKKMLDQLTLETESGKVSPMPITAPGSGILQALNVARGQTVATGHALFTIADMKTLWIRVPVYVGQLSDFDLTADVQAGALSGRDAGATRTAKPVAAPPSASALASSADLYYRIDNADGSLRPGERLGVSMLMKDSEESLTIPNGAVLLDIYGGTWVYVPGDDNSYRRERIIVRYLTEDTAVLSAGPAVGTKVVVGGSAELFGTEFGPGK